MSNRKIVVRKNEQKIETERLLFSMHVHRVIYKMKQSGDMI